MAEFVVGVGRTIREFYKISGDGIETIDDVLDAMCSYELGQNPSTVTELPEDKQVFTTLDEVVVYDAYGNETKRTLW